MHLLSALIPLSVLVQTALCHFRIPYPGERNATNFPTEAEGPCGGSNEVVTPRFPWNPKGSPLEVTLHHALSVGAVYYCPGDKCTDFEDFNVTLFETWDVFGKGNYCMTSINIPYDVGAVGTIQVVTTSAGDSVGEYEKFFNCVDIVISADGPLYNGSQCSNTSGIDINPYQVNSPRLYNATNVTVLDSFAESAMAATTTTLSSSMDMAMGSMNMEMGSSTTKAVQSTTSKNLSFSSSSTSSGSISSGSSSTALAAGSSKSASQGIFIVVCSLLLLCM